MLPSVYEVVLLVELEVWFFFNSLKVFENRTVCLKSVFEPPSAFFFTLCDLG